MTQKPKTEEEQVAFFESVHERFRQAVERVGEVHHDYRIAGTVVRLTFAGERLVPYFTRALEHLRIESHETPDATFCVWDSASTHVPMLPPPCDREAFSDRGDLWGFNSRRIKTAFHYHDFSVNLFDHERRTGIYWVTEAAVLPYWVLASPLRTLFHWWMEWNGCQLVHAAAVGIGDRALLAVGKGGLGKSSTALACLEAGFQFMGDDYGKLEAYVKNLHKGAARGRTVEDIMTDKTARTAFTQEVAQWARDYQAPSFTRDVKTLIKLKAFLHAKL